MNYRGPKIDPTEDHGKCAQCEEPLGPDPIVDENYNGFCSEECAEDFENRAVKSDAERAFDLIMGREVVR